jgi:hypothetical protein
MKKYIVCYSVVCGGSVEVVANSKNAAIDILFDLSDEKLHEITEFDGGLEVNCVEDEDGNYYEVDDDDDCECRDNDLRGYIILNSVNKVNFIH